MVRVGDRLGGFRLVRLLGEGGFGGVFLGEHPGSGLAAVKVLHLRHWEDTGFRERFAREVNLARTVAPFCTARVLDADPHGRPPWIATEYVRGVTLHQTVLPQGSDGPRQPLGESDLYRLAVSTATALTAIHSAGIVHRDFKPENIMLGESGPRVIDFGIARGLEHTAETVSELIGTPAYMAPEQLHGDQVTKAIDLFAWGSVIAFAATGRDVFTGANQAQTLTRIMYETPDLDGVPASLMPVVTWCLSKTPEQRPDAATLLATLLGAEPPRNTQNPERGGEGFRDVLDAGQRIGATGGSIVPPRMNVEHGGDWRGGEDPGGSAARPFLFKGRAHHTPVDLARAMQRDWRGTEELLASFPRRQALVRWLPEGSPARPVLNEEPGDEQVAALIALIAPELPPVFRGRDMSYPALVDSLSEEPTWFKSNWHRRHRRAWTEGASSPEVTFLKDLHEVLRVMSLHHCDTAAHDCPKPPTEARTGSEVLPGCRPYAELVDMLGRAITWFDRYQYWGADLVHKSGTDLLQRALDPDGLGAGVMRWAKRGDAVTVAAELARLPEGEWGDSVQRDFLALKGRDQVAAALVFGMLVPRIREAQAMESMAEQVIALAEGHRQLLTSPERRKFDRFNNRMGNLTALFAFLTIVALLLLEVTWPWALLFPALLVVTLVFWSRAGMLSQQKRDRLAQIETELGEESRKLEQRLSEAGFLQNDASATTPYTHGNRFESARAEEFRDTLRDLRAGLLPTGGADQSGQEALE